MNRKQREKNKVTHRVLMNKIVSDNPARYMSVCTNCGGYGAHFVPPCFGEQGYYACRKLHVKPE
jgi:hypothetical protein